MGLILNFEAQKVEIIKITLSMLVIEIDRRDLWLSNKTKFSLRGPLNRAKNKFLVRCFLKKICSKIENPWDLMG